MSKSKKVPFKFTPVANVEVLDSGLKLSEKAVYIALRSFAWRNNVCYPSVREIARRASVNVRTVTTVLKQLEAMGCIRIGRTLGGNSELGGFQKRNVYLLLLDAALFPDADNDRDIGFAVVNMEHGMANSFFQKLSSDVNKAVAP